MSQRQTACGCARGRDELVHGRSPFRSLRAETWLATGGGGAGGVGAGGSGGAGGGGGGGGGGASLARNIHAATVEMAVEEWSAFSPECAVSERAWEAGAERVGEIGA